MALCLYTLCHFDYVSYVNCEVLHAPPNIKFKGQRIFAKAKPSPPGLMLQYTSVKKAGAILATFPFRNSTLTSQWPRREVA